jgi:hypothetical protein
MTGCEHESRWAAMCVTDDHRWHAWADLTGKGETMRWCSRCGLRQIRLRLRWWRRDWVNLPSV